MLLLIIMIDSFSRKNKKTEPKISDSRIEPSFFLKVDKSVRNKTQSDLPVNFEDQLQSTTVHAIPNIARSKSYILKFIWLVLFLCCFSFCMYSTVSAILDYLSCGVLLKLESQQRMQVFCR
jgi:hypothetical protein